MRSKTLILLVAPAGIFPELDYSHALGIKRYTLASNNMTDTAQNLQVDFHGDWSQLLREQLSRLGYHVDPTESDDNVCQKYFNVLRRRLAIRARRVHVAHEFQCSTKYQAAIDIIRAKAMQGADLNPHLSRCLLTADFNDRLLNDWGLQHFHLGVIFDRPNFVVRTSPLLFACVTDTAFFMIDVKGHSDFAAQELLEIVHANWPELIRTYRMDESSSEASLTDTERKALRRSGVSAAVQLRDGTIYYPTGGGYTTSGLSLHVAMKCNYYHRRLSQFEADMRSKIAELREEAWRRGTSLGNRPQFRLQLDGEEAYAYNTETGLLIRLGPLRQRRANSVVRG